MILAHQRFMDRVGESDDMNRAEIRRKTSRPLVAARYFSYTSLFLNVRAHET